jgi:hypothetical protein
MPDGWASIRVRDGVADKHCLPLQVRRSAPMCMREWYLFDLASRDSAASTRPLARYRDVSLSLAYDPYSMANGAYMGWSDTPMCLAISYSSEMTRASGCKWGLERAMIFSIASGGIFEAIGASAGSINQPPPPCISEVARQHHDAAKRR